ncbi:MAG: imidazoleglycerol-phosphate dehydratase HisB [Candidatus Thermoplasmatota archaeon]|nr:imidazoleglycerol-phosphate dehydratase HisB [Candidatus Thermoplasmatota archaeon]
MQRKTEEVNMRIDLGEDRIDISTGDDILDHLLETLFFYMEEKVEIEAEWDLRHHLWEDMGILLGKVLKEKIDEKEIQRFGNAIIPMDDALVLASVDISRIYLEMNLDSEYGEEGFDGALVREFLNGVSRNLSATIHLKKLSGRNSHHVIEAGFKALGVALSRAVERSDGLKSTKGVL